MSFVHSASNHKDGDGVCIFLKTMMVLLLYCLPSKQRRDFVSREYETPQFGFGGAVEELPPAVEDSDLSMEYNLHANC